MTLLPPIVPGLNPGSALNDRADKRPNSDVSESPGARTSRAGEGGAREAVTRLPPKPKNTRYQSLDMWRGVACLMLLLYHATFYAEQTFRVSDPGSWSLAGLPLNLVRKFWMGVPIFFVISGYCISGSIDSLRRRPHSLWDYFVRRVRRIYPPLWTMCLIAVLFNLAIAAIPQVHGHCQQLPKLWELSAWNWIGNFAAAEAWRPNIVGGEPNYLMANTWTLCYEEQFYLVTGILLAFAARRFFAAAAVTTAIVLLTNLVLRACGWSHHGFFWDGHWVMFAAGILVYHALNYQTHWQRRWTVAALGLGALYGGGDRLLSSDPLQMHMGEYLCVACLFALALLYLRRWDDAVANHWAVVPLRWCGQRSYSIYLTHYPLVVVASSTLALVGFTSELSVALLVVPTCLAISLPIACLFYRTVEQRFLNAVVDGK